MPQRMSSSGQGGIEAVTDRDLIAFTHTYPGGRTEQRVVTAVVTGGKVRLVVWRVEGDGSLTRLFDSGCAGQLAKSVGIARCGSMTLAGPAGWPVPLFAVAAGYRETWVSFYAVDRDGIVGPFKSLAGVNINSNEIRAPRSMAAHTEEVAHFVMRDTSDRLCLAGFRWVPKDHYGKGPLFTGQTADTHPTVAAFAATRLSNTRLVTISQPKDGSRAKVCVWAEGRNPWGTTPGAKNSVFDLVHDSGDKLGRAGRVAVAAPENGTGHFLTAYQTASNGIRRLRLRTWSSTVTGLHPLNVTGELAPVRDLDVAVLRGFRGGGYRAVTATQEADDRLKVISWNISGEGAISQLAEAEAGNVDGVRVVRLSDPARFVTLGGTPAGGIELAAWQDDD